MVTSKSSKAVADDKYEKIDNEEKRRKMKKKKLTGSLCGIFLVKHSLTNYTLNTMPLTWCQEVATVSSRVQ